MLAYEDLALVNIEDIYEEDIKTNIELILDYFQYDLFIIDRIN